MRLNRLLILAVAAALLVACGSPEERAADHLDKARQLLEDGDISKGKIELQNVLQIEPKNAEARLLLAKAAETDGNFRAAVGHLLVAVDTDPDYIDARVRLGTIYFAARALDEAREQADAALALDPDDATASLLNARVNFLAGDRPGAMAEVDRALELDPGLIDAIMFKAGLTAEREGFDTSVVVIDSGIANASEKDAKPLRQFRLALLRQFGKNDQVEADLRALAEDYPDDNNYQLALAQFYASQDRTDEAERILRGLIDADPENADHKLTLVRLLLAKRGLDAAESELRGFVQEAPEDLALRFALGSLYENNDRGAEAMTAFERLAAQAPLSDEGLKARNRIIAIKIQAREMDAVRSLTQQVLADAPDNETALLYRAALRYTDQDFGGAIADLRVALRKNESSERALLLLARSYNQSGDTVLAQDTYRRLLAVNPANQEASRELASLLGRQGDVDEAADVLRARLEAEPKDAAAAAALVQALLAQQDYAAAESEARRLVEINADNALAALSMGQVFQAQGSIDSAIESYERALEEDPQATAALRALVQTLMQNGRAPEAITYLQGYLEQNPGQPDARFLLGSVNAAQGNLDTAREMLEELLADEPQAAQVWIARSNIEPPGSDERLAVFERAVEAVPTDPRIGLRAITELETRGRYDDAIAMADRVMTAQPENLFAKNSLVALLLQYRDDAASRARALELARELENSPGMQNAAIIDTVGWAYYHNGEFERAVRLLERAVASAEQIPALHYHLGMAYARNNNPVGAKQELNRALELTRLSKIDFPGIEIARETLAEIEAS